MRWKRAAAAAVLTACLTPGRALAQDSTAGPVFLSPMGEPFRGGAGGVAPQDRWFQAADLDHDGRLSLAEMRRDAARFFATLDTDRDGEIAPDELAVYETVVAPEVAALMSMSGSRETAESGPDADVTAKDSDGYPVLARGGRPLRRPRHHNGERLPASYLGLTEPVRSADTNLNQGVSRVEFDAAAQQRFHQLDSSGRGFLTPDGLKPLLR